MNNKVCIITGATGGIGYQLSLSFQEAGYRVVAIDREALQPLPPEILFIQADLASQEEISRAFTIIKSKYGSAHILINNAGIMHPNQTIQEIDPKEFKEIINLNLVAPFLLIKEFVDLNKSENYGRIINIASTRFHQNEAHWDAYGASKGGLVALTNSLCISLADTPITVNAISPGWIQAKDYDALQEIDHKQHPSRRVGKPIDIANAALFLANEENDFINGNNLIVDGGMTKKMIYQE